MRSILSRRETRRSARMRCAATAPKNAEEIITKCKDIKQQIDEELKQRLDDYGILVDDVSLINVSFSPEFARAIEAKQIAEQQRKPLKLRSTIVFAYYHGD